LEGGVAVVPEFVPFRSDYLLASPLMAERAGSYAVIDDERTHHASDHLPVLATIDPD
jgi:exonuclease III